MITIENFKSMLLALGFKKSNLLETYSRKFENNTEISVDFTNEKINYPAEIEKGDETTSNFSHNENFVVLECVIRLLLKGYDAKDLILEPRYRVGRESNTGGKADILVKRQGKSYIIIECKTPGREFKKEWDKMKIDGGQLFSYFQQDKNVQFLCLYTSNYTDVITYENYIIETKDNTAHIKESGKKGFSDANTVNELYDVWRNTYELSHEEAGIFESNINAYSAGQFALTYDDLAELNEEGKYNEFAEILRKHNISGKENAFDKLVNLFLCKIYDEKHNINNLQFCYRGVHADSYESLQDRLMLLYIKAMEEYLGEIITYVGQSEIEQQFKDFEEKNIKMDALKSQMQEYIRILKFYSHSDFSFLEVHNKKLFLQNSLVLVEVVKLFEKYKLTQNSTNQFLGNLFELFLQKGMKQDEGQFFTPIQICEFILHSLPLEKILNNKQNPKIIDYACGAGHFLNTYASIANKIKENHNSRIFGIEKEYRLSKVAQVSSAMYAHEINFTYADALDKEKFTETDFDLLIANPPYSVKGFLETLGPDMRKSYETFSDKMEVATSNAIECFFVERANDLLASESTAAIILPSTVLTRDGVYAKTREIIIKNFDVISICELGSGTFGATGTQTVILFLRKKVTYGSTKSSQLSLNLQENIENKLSFDNEYLQPYLYSYCEKMDYDCIDYAGFLQDSIISAHLSENEIFAEYIEDFKKSKYYNDLIKRLRGVDDEEVEKQVNIELAHYCLSIEKEKFLYYSLTAEQQTVIIKCPSTKEEIKQFLGYTWSKKKGDEGLKEIENPYNTPLYERNNLNNVHKIAYYIRQNYLNDLDTLPDDLRKYSVVASLNDLLDYSQSTFSNSLDINSAVGLPGTESPFTNSKYELVKLGDYFKQLPKSKIMVSQTKDSHGVYPFFTSGENVYKYHECICDGENLFLATGGNACIKHNIGKCSYSTDTLAITSSSDEMLTHYLYLVLSFSIEFIDNVYFKGMGLRHLQKKQFKNMRIPIAPMDIQSTIIDQCRQCEARKKEIDDEIANYNLMENQVLSFAKISNEQYGEIDLNIVNDNSLKKAILDLPRPKSDSWPKERIDNIGQILMCKRVFKKETSYQGEIPFYKIGTFGRKADSYISRDLYTSYKSRYNYPLKGEILISAAGTIGKTVEFDGEPAYFQDSNIIWIHPDETKVLNRFLYCIYLTNPWPVTSASITSRLYTRDLKQVQIPLPPIEAQKKISRAIDLIEQKILELKSERSQLQSKEHAIISEHLLNS